MRTLRNGGGSSEDLARIDRALSGIVVQGERYAVKQMEWVNR